jgi:hypothetical protein
MKYVDNTENHNEMPEDFNHDDYYFMETMIAKPGAYDTIDNVTKFALDEDDYEYVTICSPKSDPIYQSMLASIQREENINSIPELDKAICDLYEMFAE